jgi:hypothetical protein
VVQSKETFEFLSPEWLAAVQRITERLVGKLDTAALDWLPLDLASSILARWASGTRHGPGRPTVL